MDNKKIGDYISLKRKEKDYTQKQLADIVGVSPRAVSNWENGNNMPDISLLVPLSRALNVSLTELMEGEDIPDEKLAGMAESNTISVMRREKAIKRTVIWIAAAVISITVLFAAAFTTDLIMMKKGRPVVFSTWGMQYYPDNFGKENKALNAVKAYIADKGLKECGMYLNARTFCEVYPLCEFTEKRGVYTLYVWEVSESYGEREGIYRNIGGVSCPAKYLLTEEGGNFTVVSETFPEDGNLYEGSLRLIFPRNARKNMEKLQSNGTVERMQSEIRYRAEDAAKTYGIEIGQ